MIGNLLPSVFPNDSSGIHGRRDDKAPGVRDAAAAPPTLNGPAGPDGGAQGLQLGRHDFVHAARHIIHDALKSFAHDLRDSFHGLGFKSDMVMRLAHGVMQAAKDALKSGADFSAKLMMAAVSQTNVTSAAGTSSSFSMVASGIEITINHTTGSVEVNAAKVDIQGALPDTGGASPPQLFDFLDTEGDGSVAGAQPGLASNDLASILANDGANGEAQSLDPVLAALPGETPPAEGADAAATDQGAADAANGTQESGAPPVSPLDGVSHVVVTAFQRYLDAAGDQFTYIKLDAVVPLTSTPAPAPDSVIEAAAKEVMQQLIDPNPPAEIPPSQQVIEAPVGQPATLDLVA